MATRNNALSEIARFWLQECHGLFLRESVPVKVKHGNSDIDFIVTSPEESVTLLERIKFKHAIVETKDERDYDKLGTKFAERLQKDYRLLQGNRMISAETSCCFSMLKEQHHKQAEEIFGGNDFSKIFIFHSLNKTGLEDILAELCAKSIHVVTSSEILSDIQIYFKNHRHSAGIRNSLVGDILDMLITYHKWGPT
ncbi:MAG: hypothetical protein LBC90_06610 [Candidatus Adiutrix sp.]|jgi:hypothetical protein|nr:hypothetical protein [Candidatus Adiutrix sp.]